MATLEENINQAIADFDDIELAIEEKGVDVPAGTDTKEYGNLIRSIQTGGVVDQEYNPESSNAQSGIAVAGALATQPIKYLESLDSENYLNLYDLESGMYVLYGYFLVYPNATKRFVFSKKLFVAVSHGTVSTCVQVFYPPYNTIQYLNIYPPDEEAGTGYTYERKDAELYYMEDTRQRVTTIDENSDDEHYPSAKAVYDKVKDISNSLIGTASGEVIRVDDVSPIEHTVKAKVKSKNLFNAYDCTVSRLTKADNGTLISSIEDYYYSTIYVPSTIVNKFFYCGNTLTFSAPETPDEGKVAIVVFGTRTNGETYQEVTSEIGKKTISITVADDFTAITRVELRVNRRSSSFTDTETVYTQIQLEEGDTATEYEPYVDPSTVTVTRSGKNMFNPNRLLEAHEWSVIDGVYSGYAYPLHELYNYQTGVPLVYGFKVNTQYIFSLRGYVDATEEKTGVVFQFKYSDGTLSYLYVKHTSETPYTMVSTAGKTVVALYASYGTSITTYLKDIQLEEGTSQTDYEAYLGTTYTPEADGTVNGITSLSPTMTLLTDTAGVTIEAEYNQDSNSVREGIREEMTELDRVTAEIIGNMGDIDTALDSIIAMQESLIGGATE